MSNAESDTSTANGQGLLSSRHIDIDFAAQFKASYRVLWLVAAGVIGRREGVDDVIQDAVLCALGKLDQFVAGSDFTAWMAQIVRFVALNRKRDQQKRRAASIDLTDPTQCAREIPPARKDPITRDGRIRGDQIDFDDELLSALSNLSEIARSCLLLRTVQGMSYEEIAKILNVPQGTAMSHVHRSRRQMRRALMSGDVPLSEEQTREARNEQDDRR